MLAPEQQKLGNLQKIEDSSTSQNSGFQIQGVKSWRLHVKDKKRPRRKLSENKYIMSVLFPAFFEVNS
jgi:hypothetical protein